MKSPTKLLLLAAIVAGVTAATSAFAQATTAKKKGPTGKLYVAEVAGDSQVVTEGRVYVPKQGSAYNASGTVLETGKASRQSVVYSNGAAMFLDQNTRVEIGRFAQESFRTERDAPDVEPSVSQSEFFLAQGRLGICTGGQLSGTTTTYTTPHASINVRGRRLVIESTPEQTTVSALEGDVTIRTGNRDQSGQVVHAGERAVISRAAPGQPAVVKILPMDREALAAADASALLACSARKTVSFESVDSADGTEIAIHAAIPEVAPANLTVSEDRIEPGK